MSSAPETPPEPAPYERNRAALRTFFRIGDRWGLATDEQMILLSVTSHSTFSRWREEPINSVLPEDTLERISNIFAIYKSLQILLPEEKAADEWVRRPNAEPLFRGASALDRMLRAQVADLWVVREYLDAQRNR